MAGCEPEAGSSKLDSKSLASALTASPGFRSTGFENQHAAVLGRKCQQVEHRLGIGRSILFLDLDLTGKSLGRPNDQRTGHHVQALFETDSDGFLSGVSHRLL